MKSNPFKPENNTDQFILVLKPKMILKRDSIFCRISVFKLLSEWKTLKSSHIQNLSSQFFASFSQLPALKCFSTPFHETLKTFCGISEFSGK